MPIGIPIIIGIPPHIIIIGIPIAIIRFIMSQRSRIISMPAASIGMHFTAMPSLVISQTIRQFIGIIMGIIIGIMPGMPIIGFIPGIMPIIGFIPGIMPIIGFIPGIMPIIPGIPAFMFIGMFIGPIGIAGIMACSSTRRAALVGEWGDNLVLRGSQSMPVQLATIAPT